MSEQHKLNEGLLLNSEGNLNEAGYAFSLVKEYNRKQIKGLKWRIKEWDYYYIGCKDFGIALTIADNSYMWMVSASYLDFNKNQNITVSPLGFFSFGKLNFPSTSKIGDVSFKKKKYQFSFLNENGVRHLIVHFDSFGKEKKPFDVDVKLYETIKDNGSMVIATPFNKKGHFYYNQKINLLKPEGYFKYGDFKQSLNNCLGVLDWGRGVWTYKNTWYWSSLNANYNGTNIGWNLGYGFGDTSKASENMFFYGDQVYKLNDVKFNIPNKNGQDDFLSPWTLTSESNDINVTFKPVMDRASDSNVLIIRSNQHQVFGLFSGYVIIENKKIEFKDLPGFAEKVYNRW